MHELSLRDYLDDYIKTTSTDGSAWGYEACEYLVNLDTTGFKCIIDAGSGFSSFLMRRYHPHCEVISIDDNQKWLNKTVKFCERYDLNNGRFVMWNEFQNDPVNDVDLVLHDMGNRALRKSSAGFMIDRLKENGLIIFDDMNKPDLHDFIIDLLNKRQMIHEKIDNEDKYGRFSVEARFK